MLDKLNEGENMQGLAFFFDSEFTINRQLTEKPGNAQYYHYHNAYEMYYLVSGDRYYFIKDKTYHAKRGSLVLIKPYEIHSTSKFSNDSYERILISFKKSFLGELSSAFVEIDFFKCFENGIHLIELSRDEQGFVEALLNSMLSEYKNEGESARCFLKTSLAELLLISAGNSKRESGEEHYRDAVRKTVSLVAAYINNNYKEDISLNELAKQFFISPCYLSRTFKRITGSSFVEYVTGVRIKEAQRLLRKTDLSVSKIALSVGFKTTTHFGRAFKSVVGISPLAYRKT